MASHLLAIAKASLAASLMRPDPIAVPRADIAHFHQLIETLLSQCTATNIQLCKEWILKYTGPSATRAAALGKFLVVLSASPPALGNFNYTAQSRAARVSHRRHQISILYLLHDLLHHVKFHGAAGTATGVSTQSFETFVVQIVAAAAAHNSSMHTYHFRKLQDLIAIWSEHCYYPPAMIATLNQTVQNRSGFDVVRTESPGDTRAGEAAGPVEVRKDAPYIIPPSHGDVADPFYDLPAGNLMPCIMPNSSAPINPQVVKPLQFRAGPADARLVHAVEHLLQEADSVYGAGRAQSELDVSDVDELGQIVIPNDTLGEPSVNEAYYGWSRAFCKRMKIQRKCNERLGSPHHCRDTTFEFQAGREYSPSDSGRSRSRSPIRSLSPALGCKAGGLGRKRDRSSSRSRSPCGPLSLDKNRGPPTDLQPKLTSPRSRSRSYSPPDISILEDNPAFNGQRLSAVPPHAVPPPPAVLEHGFLGPGQMPIPPPPPPNYRGPWPPPPPPPPASATLAHTFYMNAAYQPSVHPFSSVPTQQSAPAPPPPLPLIKRTFLPESAQALHGNPNPQYAGQTGHNNTGNHIGPNNQPRQDSYPATTNAREGSRD